MNLPQPQSLDHMDRSRLIPETPAAHYLGTSPRTLRRWVAEGKIKAYRAPSGRLRFRLSELDEACTPVPNGAK